MLLLKHAPKIFATDISRLCRGLWRSFVRLWLFCRRIRSLRVRVEWLSDTHPHASLHSHHPLPDNNLRPAQQPAGLLKEPDEMFKRPQDLPQEEAQPEFQFDDQERLPGRDYA